MCIHRSAKCQCLCGNGKTTLLKGVQYMLVCMGLRDEERGTRHGLRIVTAREMSRICSDGSEQWTALLNEPMLAIDDMGTESVELVR